MKIYSKDRRHPVKVFDDMSELDGLESCDIYAYEVKSDEYYVVQLLLTETVGRYNIAIDGLRDIATVFNTEGVDKYGRETTFDFAAVADRINPVYIGFDFDGKSVGEYSARVSFDGAEHMTVNLHFTVIADKVENHGYDDITTLSRLNWLNSTRCQDDELVSPFTPIEQISEREVGILGRRLIFGDGLELSGVSSYFDESVQVTDSVQAELLSRSVTLRVDGEDFVYGDIQSDIHQSYSEYTVCGSSDSFERKVKAVLRAEGHLEYFVELIARKECGRGVTLTIPFNNDIAEYNMGLGKRGGYYSDIEIGWDGMRHDSLFVGRINSGATVRLKAENYRNPLVNVYYANLPIIKPENTWDNMGRGKISVKKGSNSTDFKAETGIITWQAGEKRVFRYELFFTPYKPIDYKKHYSVRYYHSNHMRGQEYRHLAKAKKKGLNYINVHHGNELHPYINYPFIEVDRLKRFVDAARCEGIGVKVYYTTREMSNHTAEVFAYKAFGSEIIMQKKGQGLTTFNKREWLDKYFGEDVIQAWQVHYKSGAHKGDHDIAFIITPDSRLDNYYIEGLQWLVDKIGIKGIYIDDTSLDATTLRRAKKILSKVDGLMDMHMWNHEEERAGDAACLNIYAGILPFMDSLWIGEGFDCRRLPADYILTEVSGLMYGNTSQMLEGGGDRYAGMLYAMNNRYGWGVYNADKIYKVWDDFGISDAKMYGYWHSKVPVTTDNENVKATVYLREDKALIAVYNFADGTERFNYIIDRDRLGFAPNNVERITFDIGEKLFCSKLHIDKKNTLRGRSGVMFVLFE